MEKPILFNTEMLQAVLEGRKTSTRRPIKPQPQNNIFQGFITSSTCSRDIGCCAWGDNDYSITDYAKPPYKPDDILWVRETWCTNKDMNDNAFDEGITPGYYYKVTDDGKIPYWNNDKDVIYRWHPSIHMPRAAARIFLKVMDVKVERLQDITDEECTREGLRLDLNDAKSSYEMNIKLHEMFAKLWDSTIKKQDIDRYGWTANPWVWVIEFVRLEG